MSQSVAETPTLVTPRLAQIIIDVGPDGELDVKAGWWAIHRGNRESFGVPVMPEAWRDLEPQIRALITAAREDTAWSIDGATE